MKLIELLELAASGKKFRLKSWDAGEYIYLDIASDTIVDNRGNGFCISLLYPENWEPYEELKQKVRLYKYAFKFDSTNIWKETEVFYKDDMDFNTEVRPTTNLKFHKIESSMIEVEE